MNRSAMLDSRGRKRSDTWTVNKDPSLTIQSDAAESDINEILRKYKEVGLLDHLNSAQAMFMDVTEFTDLADAMRQSREAEAVFMQLPSKMREIFHHDVAEWLDAAHDPEKRDALVRAGFIEAPEADGDGVGAGAGPGAGPGAGGEPEPEPGGEKAGTE